MRRGVPEPGGRPALHDISPESDVADHRAGVAALIHARTIREQLLPVEWFADIAWDLMLALYLEHLHGRALSMDAIERAPRATSRRRWIDVIVAQGMAEHEPDAVRLSSAGVATMRAYFTTMARL